MAGLSGNPASRMQLAAIARVRWQLFVHSLRTTKGALELFSRIVLSLVITAGGLGGAIGLGTGAWFIVSGGKTEWLAVLLWPVFLFWQFFPIMASAFTEMLDTSNLLRFPLDYRSYVVVRLVYGALDPSTVMGGLWLTGIAIGIGLANPRLFPWAALVLFVFAAVNVLLMQMVFAWVERWLAQRRTREIFAVLFFLVMISFQLVGPMVSRYGPASSPMLRKFGAEASPVQRVLPPGIAAAAIARIPEGRVPAAFAALGLLGVYGLAILWVLNVRLHAQYRGENLSEVPRQVFSRNRVQAVRLGWKFPGIPGPVMAVLEKEFRYLSRSGPVLLTLITPIFMLLIFGLGQGRAARPDGGFLQRSPDLGFPAGAAYALLLLTNLIYNNFGADGGGIQFFLASPVQFHTVLLGKNLAHMAVLALEILVVWIGASLLFRPPTPAIAVATFAGLLFAAPVNLAVGNLLSLYSPKRIELGAFGRQRASQLTVLISFAVHFVVFGLGAATLALAHLHRSIWLATLIFAILALITLTGYGLILKRLDRLALARREVLTSELCR
jgi:ABC-2 type transport system permease protein